jgi:hypothetical protein
MIFSRLIQSAALAFACLGLSGCFTSVEPLITPEDADYPFESLTYVQADSDDKITLLRVSDGYRPASEQDADDRVLLKAMGEGRYVVQVLSADSGKARYLYGFAQVAADRSSFLLTAAVAEKADRAAVQAGIAGLSICSDESDLVCIDDLAGYVDYAKGDVAGQKAVKHNILKIE